jgi:hypothetical protein
MKSSAPDESPPEPSRPPAAESGETGLPWLGSWRGVYLFVLATFVLWIALLWLLTSLFS